MKLFFLLVSALVVIVAAADPPPSRIEKRATTICGQWDTVETGSFTVYQDLWGESYGTGSQCTTVNSLSSSGILSWSTSWTWSGNGSQVKSFANAVASLSSVQLSDISSLPTTWSWSYTGTSIVADVAYDAFTSSTATGTAEYEIMIWLAALGGAGPISSTGSTIATPTIDSVTWDLYYGENGATQVYSFVASSEVTSFSGDLLAFFTYLINTDGLPSSQYLQSVGAGTEVFTGSDAVFSVSAYSLSETTGSATTSTTKATTTTTKATTTTTKATTTTTTSGSTSSASHYAQCGGSGYTGPTACASPYACVSANPYYSQCL
ncbi:Endoglucanase cel12C [Cytospora mali]|uniref:Endoglucanase cel12C n=1 Tax=Cytospora mali TaxID=578113 RepID=A0A194UX26_CYTMA|nr:Endoglucanase cel12C [Valsa mali var. pyri (nom. inval.)]